MSTRPKRCPALRGFAVSTKQRRTLRRIFGAPQRELPRLRNRIPSPNRTNCRPNSAGWAGSFLLHATLLFLGVSVLEQSAVHFHVQTGKTSMELVLLTESPSNPASPATPAKTSIPLSPAGQPVLPPVPRPFISPLPATPPAQALPRLKPVTKPRPAKPSSGTSKPPSREATNATRGAAVEAQPDDLLNQPPVYPEDSRAAREQGVVVLRVEVNAEGRASHVAILKSSGYFRLDQSARTAVRDWRFHPALINNTATASEVEVPVRFELQ
jgi:protein TonB